MVTEKMIEAAVVEMMRQDVNFANCVSGWQKRVVKHMLEAALSTDAEPVAFRWRGIGEWFYGPRAPEGVDAQPLYAAPAALSAQVQDVAGWQPIDTPPKRQSVIVCCDGIVGEAKWEYFDSADGDADDGWWWANIQIWYGQRIYPTHWMPLPAAPAAKLEGKQ